ncbi:hypothetical protein BDZ89DRAFT_1036155 [Hymenopellis radicata]|nr:hypothetical protein BDZ89DRAFT_1036155 [Hymenopellis radicata]
MPPRKSQSSSLELPPKMQLRKKQESQLHPGRVADYDIQDDPQSTKTIGDKLGERAEKKVEKDRVDATRKIAAVKLAAIEDAQRREDVDRTLTANHPPPAATPKPSKQPTQTPRHKTVNRTAEEPSSATPMGLKKNVKPSTPQVGVPDARERRKSTAEYTQKSKNNIPSTPSEDSGDDTDEFVPAASEDERCDDEQGSDDDGTEEEAVQIPGPKKTKRKGNVSYEVSVPKTPAKTKGKKHSVRATIIANARTTNDDIGTPTPRPTTKGLKRKGPTTVEEPDEDVIMQSDAEPPTAEPAPKKSKKSKPSKPESLAAKFEKKKKSKNGMGEKDPLATSTPVDEDSLVNAGASIVGDDEGDRNEYLDIMLQPKDSKSIVKITAGQGPKNAKEAKGGKKKWDLSHLLSGAAALFKTTTLVEIRRAILTTTAPWSLLEMETVQEIVDRVYGTGKYVVGAQGSFVGLSNYRCNDFRHDIPEAAAKAVSEWIIESEETLSCEADIADYAKWLIIHDESRTAPIHWQTWGEGVQRRGPLRHYLILQTLVHAYYLGVPDIKDVETADRPIGLLLLVEQAIVRELSMWVTGKRESSSVPSFSRTNYGDISDKVALDAKKHGDKETKSKKKSSFFLKALLKWDDTKWTALLKDIQESVTVHRQARKSKFSHVQTAELVEDDDDDDIILTSDPPLSDGSQLPSDPASEGNMDGKAGSGDGDGDVTMADSLPDHVVPVDDDEDEDEDEVLAESGSVGGPEGAGDNESATGSGSGSGSDDLEGEQSEDSEDGSQTPSSISAC